MGFFSDVECEFQQIHLSTFVPLGDTIVQLDAGKSTSYVLTSGGSLFACGCYIGNGSCTSMFTLVRSDILSMSAGVDHLIMVAKQNMVITIGSNQYG